MSFFAHIISKKRRDRVASVCKVHQSIYALGIRRLNDPVDFLGTLAASEKWLLCKLATHGEICKTGKQPCSSHKFIFNYKKTSLSG